MHICSTRAPRRSCAPTSAALVTCLRWPALTKAYVRTAEKWHISLLVADPVSGPALAQWIANFDAFGREHAAFTSTDLR